ncbi:uncharacterized protein TA07995 [Theileria annulata]|uniref:Uncharacterized protein n=1 Tax=Theileria annulata TaxID=5874 RepID=Q4U9V7_THEAN|nr:uncharacterized protein TA07995 [Theileria annulata]CAI76396.1 hypothetical protein TA07995 [Theileria annulata]|eukprot:XP_953021.1 hypothetical protein TA07995 [Theileria annulata]
MLIDNTNESIICSFINTTSNDPVSVNNTYTQNNAEQPSENVPTLNDIKLLEDDFRSAISEYKSYNYSKSFETFTKVAENSILYKDSNLEKKSLKYLCKLSVLNGDYEKALYYLAKLDVSPKSLSLFARCLLLKYGKTKNKNLLYTLKQLLNLILSKTQNENKLNQQKCYKDNFNFVVKNNLLLCQVFWELEEYVSYYNLLDRVNFYINKSKKTIKNKNVILFNKIANLSFPTKCYNCIALLENQLNESDCFVKELKNKTFDSFHDEKIDLVYEITINLLEEDVELKVNRGSVRDILQQLLEFYVNLEKTKCDWINKYMYLSVDINENKIVRTETDTTPEAKRVRQSRQGQRDVKRRVIAVEGASAKSIYLKNYWTSVCNFFYLNNFNNALNSIISSHVVARNEEELEEDAVGTIYPSDIARFLKYSESQYNLDIMMNMGFKGKSNFSEKSSLYLFINFFHNLKTNRQSVVSFSLKLLEFLLKNQQVGSNYTEYQLLISYLYTNVNKTLVELVYDRNKGGKHDDNKNTKVAQDVLHNTLFRYNNFFTSSNCYVQKFKRINERYSGRILFTLYKNLKSLQSKNDSNRNGYSKEIEVVNLAFNTCLFHTYKLSKRDFLKKIHLLYFHTKRLWPKRLEINDYICKLIKQYSYIMQYETRDLGLNFSFCERKKKINTRNGKIKEYINKLLNSMSNFSLNETNLEGHLDKFVKKFFILLSKHVDIGAVNCIYYYNKGMDEEDDKMREVAMIHDKYVNMNCDKHFLSELQEFLVEITCLISVSETLPKWTNKLLLFLGDILSVISFSLHKNITNIQVNDKFNILNNVSFSHQFLITLSSTLLVIINKLYYYKCTYVISTGTCSNEPGTLEMNNKTNVFINCLKQVELVDGFSLVLSDTISRIYTNVVFIIYYLVNYLMSDYSNQDSKIIYYLYLTFSQTTVIILSSFFDIKLYTTVNNSDEDKFERFNNMVKIEFPCFLEVLNENEDSINSDSSTPGEPIDDSDMCNVISGNIMDYYYTLNNILDSLLQIESLFRENDISIESNLIPSKLENYLLVSSNGMEFSDSPSNINLNMYTTIFNKFTHLFNFDVLSNFKKDLEIVESTNHLLNDEYTAIFTKLYQNIIRNNRYRADFKSNEEKFKDALVNFRERSLMFNKDVTHLIYEMFSKCMTNIAREISSPVTGLMFIYFKKFEIFDNTLDSFKVMFDQISIPIRDKTPFFKLYTNPLIIHTTKTLNALSNKGSFETINSTETNFSKESSENHVNEHGKVNLEGLSGSLISYTNVGDEAGAETLSLNLGFESSLDLKLLEYVNYTRKIENLLKSDNMFDYGQVEQLYLSTPEYDFMHTHKMIYIKKLKTYTNIDNIITFDIESYSPEQLLERLEVLNMASVVVPRSYDVLFLSIIVKFELFLSILDSKAFHPKYSFHETMSCASVINSKLMSASTAKVSHIYKLDHLEMVKQLLYLLYLATARYSKLLNNTANCLDKRLLFYNDHDCIDFKKSDVETPGTYSFKLNNRIDLFYFIRITLLLYLLKRGELIPSALLFQDYTLLLKRVNPDINLNFCSSPFNSIDHFVSFMPCEKIYDNTHYSYLLYFQIKILERIIKNVPITSELWISVYSKILLIYKNYLEIIVRNKSLDKSDVEDENSQSQDSEVPNAHVDENSNPDMTMDQLNEVFVKLYDSDDMDDELIISYYKLQCARLRLCYIMPKFYYLAAPYSFSPEYNSLFNEGKFKEILAMYSYYKWGTEVESKCKQNNIDRNKILEDIARFYNKIKNRYYNILNFIYI